jgi:hypothetical protein
MPPEVIEALAQFLETAEKNDAGQRYAIVGLAKAGSLQRMWRDASIATRHGVVATDPDLEICGPR